MIIYGKNTVLEALKHNKKIKEIYLTKNNLNLNISFPKDKIIFCSVKQLDEMTKGNHQGIAALVADYQYVDLDAFLKEDDNKKTSALCILDGLEDPHNLGAILRTADATGIDGIIIPKNRNETAKANAKKFINYLATKQGCKTFVEEAHGAFLAFDYSPVQLGDLANDKFVKSVYDKITQCTNFNLDSDAAIARYNSSIIKGAWYNDEYKYTEAFQDPSDTRYQPTTLLETLYGKARSQWSSLISSIPVS